MQPNFILNFVIKSLFPKAKLVESGSTPLAFFVKVLFESPIRSESLGMIEERFKAFLAHPEPMQVMEMIPSNAAELLRHHGEMVRAEAALQMEGPTLFVLKIGNIYDVCETKPSLDIPYKEVKLVDWIEGEGQIWGVVDGVKEKAKAYHHAKKVRFDISGQEIGLFKIDEGGVHWSSKGVKVRELITKMWHGWMERFHIEVISTPNFRHYCRHHRGQFAQLGEWDEIFLPQDRCEAMASKLFEALEELWKLCGIDHLPFEEFGEGSLRVIQDAYLNDVPLCHIEKEEEGWYVSLIEAINTYIFVSLEHNGGHLPIGLEPIQVSLGLMKQSFDSVAQSLKKELENEGLRVKIVKNVFKTKHDASLFAKRHDCPYFYLVTEENGGELKVRAQKKFEALSLEEFVKCVLKGAKKS